MGELQISRREAVKRVGGWLVLSGVLGAGCGGGGGESVQVGPCGGVPTGTNTGLRQTDIPANGLAYNAASHMFVCHDAFGFYAMTSICTHAGCDIATSCCGGAPLAAPSVPQNLSQGFTCGCHGSGFDADGNVTRGPASLPLSHYKLAVDAGGTIWVDATQSVGPGTRCV